VRKRFKFTGCETLESVYQDLALEAQLFYAALVRVETASEAFCRAGEARVFRISLSVYRISYFVSGDVGLGNAAENLPSECVPCSYQTACSSALCDIFPLIDVCAADCFA